MLHIKKLAVGVKSFEHLVHIQQNRLLTQGQLFHQTKMFPKQKNVILTGGSLYWVIKGVMLCRQQIVDILAGRKDEGQSYTRFILDPVLVETCPKPHRPFQGWRYLKPEEAPADCLPLQGDTSEMPSKMVDELRNLGLL